MPGFQPIPTNGQFKNISGQRFGRLRVLEFVKTQNGKSYWHCTCECGSQGIFKAEALQIGHTKSCGCLHRETMRKKLFVHGMSRTRIYVIWTNIVKRCTKKDCWNYLRYGGRGIKVCSRWRKSFVNFYHDMGEPPSSKHEIDRIDNDGNYSPENCRWVTKTEQARNRRNNTRIEYAGLTLCIVEWEDRLNVRRGTIRSRLHRGWSVERALTQPVGKKRREH